MACLQLSVLTQPEIEQMHRSNPGVRIAYAPFLWKLARAGARVDEASDGVRCPREMVEELRRQAPPVARMTGLNGRVLGVGGGNRYYSSLILDPYVIDYERGPRRPVLEGVRRQS
jgi:trimethylamine:corrinoid methyltransferase-like protein